MNCSPFSISLSFVFDSKRRERKKKDSVINRRERERVTGDLEMNSFFLYFFSLSLSFVPSLLSLFFLLLYCSFVHHLLSLFSDSKSATIGFSDFDARPRDGPFSEGRAPLISRRRTNTNIHTQGMNQIKEEERSWVYHDARSSWWVQSPLDYRHTIFGFFFFFFPFFFSFCVVADENFKRPSTDRTVRTDSAVMCCCPAAVGLALSRENE